MCDGLRTCHRGTGQGCNSWVEAFWLQDVSSSLFRDTRWTQREGWKLWLHSGLHSGLEGLEQCAVFNAIAAFSLAVREVGQFFSRGWGSF